MSLQRTCCPTGLWLDTLGAPAHLVSFVLTEKVLQKRFCHFGNSHDMRWSFTMCFPFVSNFWLRFWDESWSTRHAAIQLYNWIQGADCPLSQPPNTISKPDLAPKHASCQKYPSMLGKPAVLVFCCKALTWFSKKDMGIGCSLDWYDHHQWLTCVLWWTWTSAVAKCCRSIFLYCSSNGFEQLFEFLTFRASDWEWCSNHRGIGTENIRASLAYVHQWPGDRKAAIQHRMRRTTHSPFHGKLPGLDSKTLILYLNDDYIDGCH